MRQSTDRLDAEGNLTDGFDYDLQVWVLDGAIQTCGHPAEMKRNGCCRAEIYAGYKLRHVQEGLKRPVDRRQG